MPAGDAWIDMVDETAATGELSELYAQLRDPQTGQVDNILRIHGLHPATLRAHFLLYTTLMHAPSGVPRVEREMIAVVVSSLNHCHY